MTKKRKIILAVIIAISIGTGIFYMPVPVLDIDEIDGYDTYIKVYYVEEDYGYSDRDYIVSDDAVIENVLNYLSTCKMRRTLFSRTRYQYIEFFVDVTDTVNLRNGIYFMIQKDGGNELKHRNGFRYRFLNSTEVIKNLEEIIIGKSPDTSNAA